MTLEEIKTCTDKDALRELQSACQQRIKALEIAVFEAAVDKSWNRIKNYTKGATLYFAFTGHLLGADFKYGEAMTVIGIQPRARRLRARLANGREVYFEARGVHRYGIQPEKPAPRSAETESLGRAIADVSRNFAL